MRLIAYEFYLESIGAKRQILSANSCIRLLVVDEDIGNEFVSFFFNYIAFFIFNP